MADNFVQDVGALSRIETKRLNFPQAGIIVSVDRLVDGFVDVQPVVSKLGNDLVKSDFPILYDVPVIFPSTASTSIQFPVAVGDGVLLIFTQFDSSNFINGNKDVHLPNLNSFLGLHHATAIVGFNPYLESPHNPNNYAKGFDGKSLNIVHNKASDKEVKISFNEDGSMNIIAATDINVQSENVNVECTNITANCDVVTVSCDTINFDCNTINASSANIVTDGDFIVRGLSVFDNTTQHDHNYTDDGRPMITAQPNVR